MSYKQVLCPKCGNIVVRHNTTKNPNARRNIQYVCLGCGRVPWECSCKKPDGRPHPVKTSKHADDGRRPRKKE